MIFIQVLQHQRGVLQAVEGIERNAMVNIACISKDCLLILDCA